MKLVMSKEKVDAYLAQMASTRKVSQTPKKYRAAMQQAAADPDFRRDVEDITKDFAHIDELKGE